MSTAANYTVAGSADLVRSEPKRRAEAGNGVSSLAAWAARIFAKRDAIITAEKKRSEAVRTICAKRSAATASVDDGRAIYAAQHNCHPARGMSPLLGLAEDRREEPPTKFLPLWDNENACKNPAIFRHE